MKLFLAILFLINSNTTFQKDNLSMPQSSSVKKYSYLALGDSYTIGESVATTENFPNQVAGMMKSDSIVIEPVRIIAKTGWTTDELEDGIVASNAVDPLRTLYDFVSLLIGVNNQYRGRDVTNYKNEFEALLKKAIQFAGNKSDHVVVVSIPDWGFTPFANGSDRKKIASEIDAYNEANKKIAAQYHVHYIDITSWTREAFNNKTMVADDGLHPSGKEYKRWAQKIAGFFRTKM